MYRKHYVFAIFLSILSVFSVYAQKEISISYFNKAVYTPDSQVFIKITIKNQSAETWRFKLADDKRMSVGFDVRTISNRILPASDSWKNAMSSSVHQFYREIALEPGEEYSFIEELKSYIDIKNPGSFLVSCSLYPELNLKREELSIKSNTLSLSVRPGAQTPNMAENFRAETAEILKAEKISPDNVVSRTITARQNERWNEFFLYLDIERLLLENPNKKRAYDRESDDGRRRMLSAYKSDLMTNVVDKDIVLTPSSFEIIETTYSTTRGTVVVLEKFNYDDVELIKEYEYIMEKRDDIWYIVSYKVRNKGTK